MSLFRNIGFCLMALTAAACGGGSGSSGIATTSSSLHYRIDENINGYSCTTLDHTFASQSDYCLGLKDDNLNQYCGKTERERLYKANCEGQGTSHSQRLRYNIKESSNYGDCTTGEHSFSSHDEYCAGLNDEGLNQNCGWRERRRIYEAQCNDN